MFLLNNIEMARQAKAVSTALVDLYSFLEAFSYSFVLVYVQFNNIEFELQFLINNIGRVYK